MIRSGTPSPVTSAAATRAPPVNPGSNAVTVCCAAPVGSTNFATELPAPLPTATDTGGGPFGGVNVIWYTAPCPVPPARAR